MNKLYIGADIGGSHITCIALNPANRQMNTSRMVRQDVDCHGSSNHILDAWSFALSSLIDSIGRENLDGIGFAMPGPFDYYEGVAWFRGVQKYDHLYGINVRDELRHRLHLDPVIPVRFLNDASSFAMGEAWIGMAAPYERSMAITLGTGFGSAFIAHGLPVESGPEVPESGCVYHIPYDKGIADDYFSTRWFQKKYHELTGADIAGAREIASIAPTNPAMQAIFEDFGERLGKFLAPWLIQFRAECLVIGGSIALSSQLFINPMKDSLNANGFSAPVHLSVLGELAGIAGAARLCDDAFYSRLPFISSK